MVQKRPRRISALTRLDRRGICLYVGEHVTSITVFQQTAEYAHVLVSHTPGVLTLFIIRVVQYGPTMAEKKMCSHTPRRSQYPFYVGGYFILMLNTMLIIISINLSKDRGSSYRILLSHAPRMWRYFISIIEVILNCKDVLMSVPEE